MPLKSAAFNIVAHDKTGKSFNSVDKSLRGLKERSSSVASGLKAITGAAIALAGPVAFGALIKSSLDSADALAKTSDKLGIATQDLAGLRHAAELTGVSQGNLDTALQRFTRRLGEAAHGTGAAKDALVDLGLNAQQLSLEGPHSAFLQVADAMSNVQSQSDRVRLAFKLFDSEGVALVNTLALGSSGLNDAAIEAENLGLAISRVDAAKVEQANDAMTRIGQAATGVARTIAIQLAPFITVISKRFLASAGDAELWRSIVVNSIEGVMNAVALLADSFNFLKRVWKSLELGFAALVAAVSSGIDSLYGNILKVASYAPVIGESIGKAQEELEIFASSARAEVSALTREIADMGQQPSNAEGIRRFMEELRAAEEEAEEISIRQAERNKVSTFIPNIDDIEIAEKRHIKAIKDAAKRENDGRRENAKAQRRYNKLLLEYQKKHEQEMKLFRNLSWQSQVATVSNSLIEMTASVASSNKAMFTINKVASIAQAIINTAVGVTRALSAYPPPLSFAMAAAQAAAGIAQVTAIKSQSFNAGGYVPNTPQGAAPSAIVTPTPTTTETDLQSVAENEVEAQEPKKVFNITISGNPTSQQVRELIGMINDEIGDGAELMTSTA